MLGNTHKEENTKSPRISLSRAHDLALSPQSLLQAEGRESKHQPKSQPKPHRPRLPPAASGPISVSISPQALLPETPGQAGEGAPGGLGWTRIKSPWGISLCAAVTWPRLGTAALENRSLEFSTDSSLALDGEEGQLIAISVLHRSAALSQTGRREQGAPRSTQAERSFSASRSRLCDREALSRGLVGVYVHEL